MTTTTSTDTIFGINVLYGPTARRVDNFGAYWQGQTASVEADTLEIGRQAAYRMAWENRTRRPIVGLLVEVDRIGAVV